MKLNRSIAALCLFALSLSALAHGNMDHILGTVAKIAGNVVTVEKDGKATDVVLSPTTEFIVNDKPGKVGDLRVGDRVVMKLVHPAK
jgi:hypothetical protein